MNNGTQKMRQWLRKDYAEIHHNYAEITQILRSHYALLRSHYAVITQSLRNHYAIITHYYQGVVKVFLELSNKNSAPSGGFQSHDPTVTKVYMKL